MNKIHGGNIYEIGLEFGLDPMEIIDFSASINPLGFSKKAARKLRKNLEAIRHYPDPSCFHLHQALAQFYGLPPEQILAGAGSTEFIYSIPRVLKIRRALIVTPAFSEYEKALEIATEEPSRTIHYFETDERDGFELSTEGLRFALTQGYDALYLCNPNNPTGILTPQEELVPILAQAERENTWFILDEAFMDLAEEESLKQKAGSSSRLIILRSLTKFFALPGLRLGCLIAHPEVIRRFRDNQAPWTVNALAQIAALESLQDKNFVIRTREFIARERDYLRLRLQAIPGFIPYPGTVNFLFVQLHPSLNLTAAELQTRLISQGILIRDCNSFHHIGPFFFRIAVRTRKENNALLKALRQVVR